MERNIKTLAPEQLMAALPELLEETDAVSLVISGNSMAPFLVDGRDTVYLSRVKEPLKRGDMVLYRRENGQYVLHRIYSLDNGIFSAAGDAQQLIEYGISVGQVIAVVTAVRRKGKLMEETALLWRFFATAWLSLLPWRKKLLCVYTRLRMRRGKE